VKARQVLARLATIATMVPAELLDEVRVVKEDPDDDVPFATALAAGAPLGEPRCVWGGVSRGRPRKEGRCLASGFGER